LRFDLRAGGALMKINREARQSARQIFRACIQDGRLNEAALRGVLDDLVEARPRNYFAILSQLRKLTELWVQYKTHVVESATALADSGAAIFSELEKKYGPALGKRYAHRPDLIGGLRVQVGSDILDGSVRGRLNLLQNELTRN
jgi:F-type H+-transporting ATPase subunit delta